MKILPPCSIRRNLFSSIASNLHGIILGLFLCSTHHLLPRSLMATFLDLGRSGSLNLSLTISNSINIADYLGSTSRPALPPSSSLIVSDFLIAIAGAISHLWIVVHRLSPHVEAFPLLHILMESLAEAEYSAFAVMVKRTDYIDNLSPQVQVANEEKLANRQSETLKANYKKYELVDGVLGDGTAKRLGRRNSINLSDAS